MATELNQDQTWDWSAVVLPDGGTLLLDHDIRRSSAANLGGIMIDAVPGAVLRPGGARDIAHIAEWASLRGVPVSAAGSRHQMGGQAAPGPGGLLIDMRGLNTVHEVTDSHITADAGATLRQAIDAAAQCDLRLASGSTGYTGMTLGGLVAAGGITNAHHSGALVDTVTELEIVTATGDILTCNRDTNPELFAAALAGAGQVGIVTRLQLAVTPAPDRVQTWTLLHDTTRDGALAELFDDIITLSIRDDVDELWVQWCTDDLATWRTLRIHVGIHIYGDNEPVAESVFAGTHQTPTTTHTAPWIEHATKHDHLYDEIMPVWEQRPKVWTCMFLPERTIRQWMRQTLDTLTDEDFGTELSQGLLFPHAREAFTTSALALPEASGFRGEKVFLWGALLETAGGHDDWIAPRLHRSSGWINQVRELGGTVYPIGSEPTTEHEAQVSHGAATTEILDTVDPHRIFSGT